MPAAEPLKHKNEALGTAAAQVGEAHMVEKMQHLSAASEQQCQSLSTKKAAQAERWLQKAHKKGQVLPQDLKCAGLS